MKINEMNLTYLLRNQHIRYEHECIRSKNLQ